MNALEWFKENIKPILKSIKTSVILRPSSVNDNEIIRADGTDGLVQNSPITISDSGGIDIPGPIKYTGGGNTDNGKVMTTDGLGNITLKSIPPSSSFSSFNITVGGTPINNTSNGVFSGPGLSNSPVYSGDHVADGVLSDYGYLNTPALAETSGVMVVFPTAVNLKTLRVLMSATAAVFKSTGVTVRGRLTNASPWVDLVVDLQFSTTNGVFTDVPINNVTPYLEYNILFTSGVSTTYRACTEVEMISQTTSTQQVEGIIFTSPDSSTWGLYVDDSGSVQVVQNP